MIYNGREYSSKKHPMLEHIFFKKNPKGDTDLEVIAFTLDDISEGYRACGISEPASISNTILDLVRQRRPISSRLPPSIYNLGYDLRKKTGASPEGGSYAGEFVFMGVGNSINSWLEWPQIDAHTTISSLAIPKGILEFIRRDEGALFSIIDYCDVFSQLFHKSKNSIIRVQNPLKWQPNEIDGFYFSNEGGKIQLFPVEAKALTTGDDINLEQMQGALQVIVPKYSHREIILTPLAVKMMPNSILIAEFKSITTNAGTNPRLETHRFHKVVFDPPIQAWL